MFDSLNLDRAMLKCWSGSHINNHIWRGKNTNKHNNKDRFSVRVIICCYSYIAVLFIFLQNLADLIKVQIAGTWVPIN